MVPHGDGSFEQGGQRGAEKHSSRLDLDEQFYISFVDRGIGAAALAPSLFDENFI